MFHFMFLTISKHKAGQTSSLSTVLLCIHSNVLLKITDFKNHRFICAIYDSLLPSKEQLNAYEGMTH